MSDSIPQQVFNKLFESTGVSISELESCLNFNFFEESRFWVVNYLRDANGKPIDKRVSTIRGWVFDELGNLLIRGFPATHSDFELFPGKTYAMLPQGPTIRFCKRNDQVFYGTFTAFEEKRKLQANGVQFSTRFSEVIGMDINEFGNSLFGDKPNSDIVHVFVLCIKELMPCFPIKCEDFVCYLGAYSQGAECYIGREDVDFENRWHCPEFSGSFSGIVPQPNYTFEEAREMLKQNIGVLMIENGQATVVMNDRLSLAYDIFGNQGNVASTICNEFQSNFEPSVYELVGVNPDEGTLYERNRLLFSRCAGPNQEEQVLKIYDDILSRREIVFDKICSLVSEQGEQFLIDLRQKCKEMCEFTRQNGVKGVNFSLSKRFDNCLNMLSRDIDLSRKSRPIPLRKLLEQRYGSVLYTMIFKLPL